MNKTIAAVAVTLFVLNSPLAMADAEQDDQASYEAMIEMRKAQERRLMEGLTKEGWFDNQIDGSTLNAISTSILALDSMIARKEGEFHQEKADKFFGLTR